LYTTTEEFECIARKQRPDLLEVRRAFFDNADDAEDVAQGMLLRLWLVRTRIDAQFSINTRVPEQSKSISFEEYSQKNR
jgi:DNA-directed RNA polymerase specialized sigma24 family protein